MFKRFLNSVGIGGSAEGEAERVTETGKGASYGGMGMFVPTNKSNVTNPEQAMRLATVYRCTSILSGGIASLPLQVKRRSKQGGYYAVDEESDLNYLLTNSPNERQTAYEMLKNAVIQMVNLGNAYIYIGYAFGEVDSLTLLSPGTVSYDKIQNSYLVSDMVNNIFGTFEPNDIIHLRNMSLDGGYTGVSTIHYASRVMSVSASADNQSWDTFKNGNRLKGFISGQGDKTKGFGDLQDAQLRSVSDRVEMEMSNGKNIFNLPGDMKFNSLSISSVDAELLETKKFSVLDICRFYGVHPDKAFAGQSSNYKASELSQVLFMTDTLSPILRQVEAEFNKKLVPRGLSRVYKIAFNTEDMYLTDLMTEASYIEKTIQTGVMTVNDWRQRKGKAPIKGGDVAMISCNVAPIDSAKIKGEKTEIPPVVDKK